METINKNEGIGRILFILKISEHNNSLGFGDITTCPIGKIIEFSNANQVEWYLDLDKFRLKMMKKPPQNFHNTEIPIYCIHQMEKAYEREKPDVSKGIKAMIEAYCSFHKLPTNKYLKAYESMSLGLDTGVS